MFWDLAVVAGEMAFDESSFGESRLVTHPILATPEGAVVAAPGNLLASLRHRLLVLAAQHECRAEVAVAIAELAFVEATLFLEATGAIPIPNSKRVDGIVQTQTFILDSDKRIHLAVLTDDLSAYPADDPYSPWPEEDLGQIAEDALNAAAAAHGAPGDRTLQLAVIESMGRPYGFGMSGGEGLHLVLTLDELQCLVDIEGSDPLFLWYFAAADTALHQAATVLAFSALDRYAHYKDNDQSFYFGDGERPNLVSFDVADGFDLRVDAMHRTDRHFVLSDSGDRFIEVWSDYGANIAPISRTHPFAPVARRLVEIGDLRIWVELADPQLDNQERSELLSEAATFWLWRIADRFHEQCLLAAGPRGDIVVNLDVAPALAWVDAPDSSLSERDEELSVVELVATSEGRIHLACTSDGGVLVSAVDNAADRSIVRTLMAGLVSLGASFEAGDLDLVAPRGDMRMLRSVKPTEFALVPGDIPSVRWINEAARSQVLDAIGARLAELGIPVGTVASDGRAPLLNQLVAWLYEQILQLMSEFDQAELLRGLIRYDESVIHTQAVEFRDMPSRIRCFGATSDLATRLKADNLRSIESARASRFLIEVASATQSAGRRALNVETYDRLVALSAEIISLGTLSDAIHYNLSDTELSRLPSGRLGISRDARFHEGLGRHAQVQALRDEERLLKPRAAPTERSVPAPPHADVEAAAEAEYGLTFTELADLLGDLLDYGIDQGRLEPTVCDRDVLLNELEGSLGWPRARIDTVLDSLTLASVDALRASGTDWYPWRFARDRSYLNRPLVEVASSSGRTMMWGSRRLATTGGYRLATVYTARLNPHSTEMRNVLGWIRSKQNDNFELVVREAVVAAGVPNALSRVKRLGGKRISNPRGGDLGDVDVLALDVRSKTVFVIEAKDYGLARTPPELANEIKKLAIGDRSAVQKLLRRTEWIRSNIQLVPIAFGMTLSMTGWRVVPFVVTSEELVSPYLTSVSVPVVSLAGTMEFLARVRRNPRPYAL